MTEAKLARAFRSALAGNTEPSLSDAALDERLSAGLAQARADYPNIELPADDFAAYVAQRFEDDSQLVEPRLSDLYLCAAAARGDDVAVRVFEDVLLPELAPALGKLRLSGAEKAELDQRLREELFVARPDRRPKIAEYSARGDLRGWLKITGVRLGLKVIRARTPNEDSDDALEQRAADGEDPELSLIKAEYRPVFRDAFQRALDSLDDRQRLLLKQHFLDSLTVDQLGAVHHVHRATAARWLAQAREELLKRVRRQLMSAANITAGECDNVIELVRSGLGTTFRRRLGGP